MNRVFPVKPSNGHARHQVTDTRVAGQIPVHVVSQEVFDEWAAIVIADFGPDRTVPPEKVKRYEGMRHVAVRCGPMDLTVTDRRGVQLYALVPAHLVKRTSTDVGSGYPVTLGGVAHKLTSPVVLITHPRE